MPGEGLSGRLVGNGNVALDVARILLRDPADLASTDIADHALAVSRTSAAREVVVPGRRGPVQASFSARELRVLCELVEHRTGNVARRLVLRFEARGVIPNDSGRIRATEGVYVAGWINRGASGLIGANRGCAKDTVEAMLQDAHAGRLPTVGTLSAGEVTARLAERVHTVVSYGGWQAPDTHERRLGELGSRPRVKVTRVPEMLELARSDA